MQHSGDTNEDPVFGAMEGFQVRAKDSGSKKYTVVPTSGASHHWQRFLLRSAIVACVVTLVVVVAVQLSQMTTSSSPLRLGGAVQEGPSGAFMLPNGIWLTAAPTTAMRVGVPMSEFLVRQFVLPLTFSDAPTIVTTGYNPTPLAAPACLRSLGYPYLAGQLTLGVNDELRLLARPKMGISADICNELHPGMQSEAVYSDLIWATQRSVCNAHDVLGIACALLVDGTPYLFDECLTLANVSTFLDCSALNPCGDPFVLIELDDGVQLTPTEEVYFNTSYLLTPYLFDQTVTIPIIGNFSQWRATSGPIVVLLRALLTGPSEPGATLLYVTAINDIYISAPLPVLRAPYTLYDRVSEATTSFILQDDWFNATSGWDENVINITFTSLNVYYGVAWNITSLQISHCAEAHCTACDGVRTAMQGLDVPIDCPTTLIPNSARASETSILVTTEVLAAPEWSNITAGFSLLISFNDMSIPTGLSLIGIDGFHVSPWIQPARRGSIYIRLPTDLQQFYDFTVAPLIVLTLQFSDYVSSTSIRVFLRPMTAECLPKTDVVDLVSAETPAVLFSRDSGPVASSSTNLYSKEPVYFAPLSVKPTHRTVLRVLLDLSITYLSSSLLNNQLWLFALGTNDAFVIPVVPSVTQTTSITSSFLIHTTHIDRTWALVEGIDPNFPSHLQYVVQSTGVRPCYNDTVGLNYKCTAVRHASYPQTAITYYTSSIYKQVPLYHKTWADNGWFMSGYPLNDRTEGVRRPLSYIFAPLPAGTMTETIEVVFSLPVDVRTTWQTRLSGSTIWNMVAVGINYRFQLYRIGCSNYCDLLDNWVDASYTPRPGSAFLDSNRVNLMMRPNTIGFTANFAPQLASTIMSDYQYEFSYMFGLPFDTRGYPAVIVSARLVPLGSSAPTVWPETLRYLFQETDQWRLQTPR